MNFLGFRSFLCILTAVWFSFLDILPIYVLLIFTVVLCVKVPISQCSQECPFGYAKTQIGSHKCCFRCEICPSGTYINTAGALL